MSTFLSTHWRGLLLVVVGGVLGALGGWVAHRPGPPETLAVACDAGATAVASIDCYCDAGTTVKWRDRDPVVVYLPGDAGPCLEVVEEDVTVTTDATATASTGA